MQPYLQFYGTIAVFKLRVNTTGTDQKTGIQIFPQRLVQTAHFPKSKRPPGNPLKDLPGPEGGKGVEKAF
jgi:hypothetical protein